jgi:hypothetical protein
MLQIIDSKYLEYFTKNLKYNYNLINVKLVNIISDMFRL